MQLPGPMRAVVGLAATVADEAKHLPDRAIELPMLAVSTALQMSLKLQQRYAHLTARGDEVLSRQPSGDAPPAWATFDEPVGSDPLRGSTLARRSAATAGELIDQIRGGEESDSGPARSRRPTAAKKAPTRTDSARTPAPRKSESSKSAPRTSASRKSAPRKSAAKSGGAGVNAPRNTAPSKFDAVSDEALAEDVRPDDAADPTASDS